MIDEVQSKGLYTEYALMTYTSCICPRVGTRSCWSCVCNNEEDVLHIFEIVVDDVVNGFFQEMPFEKQGLFLYAIKGHTRVLQCFTKYDPPMYQCC